MRLKSVFLICRHLAETLAFYRDELGLRALSDSRLELGEGVELHLHGELSEADRELYGLTNPEPGARPGVVLSLRVERLRPYLERFEGRLKSGPTQAPWGDRLVILEDPEGNLVELAAPPK